MGCESSQCGPRVLLTAKRLLAMVLHSREIHVPVGLPVIAFVERERLLPARGAVGDARPQVAHTDGAAIVRVVAVEGADALLEAAVHRREQMARPAAVEPVDRPAPDVGIPGAQAHAAITVARQLDVVLVHVAEAGEEFGPRARSADTDPGVAIGQA